MITIGIDASRANIATRTGTEWYAFSLLRVWMLTQAFATYRVRLYVREPLLKDFPPIPAHWEVRVLTWKPGLLWTQLRLSFELLLHPVNALFVPAHTIPFIHPQNTFTTLHDVGFEKMRYVYNSKDVAAKKSWLSKKIINAIVRCLTLGKYGANEFDYHRFSATFAISHAKAIFTVSHFSKNEIASVYPKHPPIHVAYNGIDTHLSPKTFSRDNIIFTQKKYNLKNPYILSLGRIEKKKGSLELLKAFAKARQDNALAQELVYIGSPGFGSEEVIAFVKTQKLDRVVHFLGWLPQNDSMALLAGADVFAMLSAYEGFGVPVLQSILLGVPVLASDLLVFKEIAGEAPSYTNPLDVKLTSEKLTALCAYNQESRHRVQEAAASIRNTFTWEASASVIANEISKHLL